MYKDSQIQPKIIAFSGHVEQQYIDKAWRYELDEFVFKPVKLSILVQILKELFM